MENLIGIISCAVLSVVCAIICFFQFKEKGFRLPLQGHCAWVCFLVRDMVGG